MNVPQSKLFARRNTGEPDRRQTGYGAGLRRTRPSGKPRMQAACLQGPMLQIAVAIIIVIIIITIISIMFVIIIQYLNLCLKLQITVASPDPQTRASFL